MSPAFGNRPSRPASSRTLPTLRLIGYAGEFVVEHVLAGDWLRMAELVNRSRELPLGTVDASVVAAAERLGVTGIATLDRHFSVVRPTHADTFRLFP